MLRLAWLALTVLLAGATTSAQHATRYSPEVRDLLARLDATLHSPWAEMREFSADIEMVGAYLPGSTIRYLWRRDGESEVRIDGAPNPAMEYLLENTLRESVLDEMMSQVTFQPTMEAYRGCDVSLSRDAEMFRLEIVSHRAETRFVRQTQWVDDRFIPVRYESDNVSPLTDPYHESTRLEYVQIAGRWVLSRAFAESDNAMVPGKVELELEWVEIGEHLVVGGMTQWSGWGEARVPVMSLRFRDIRIDEGFGDPVEPDQAGILAPSRPRVLTLGSFDEEESRVASAAGDVQDITLQITEPGPFSASARSYAFSPSLVLRDPTGEIVASSQGDGFTTVVQAESSAAGDFTLEVSRGEGLPGTVELRWAPGTSRPEPASPGEVIRHLDQMQAVSSTAWAAGRQREGEAYAHRGVSVARRLLGPGSPQEASCLLDLSMCHSLQGRFEQALAEAGDAVAIFEAGGDLRALRARHFRAETFYDLGRYGEAREELETCIERMTGVRGLVAEQREMFTLILLAQASLGQARDAEAAEWLERSLELAREFQGESGRQTLLSQALLAVAYRRLGRLDEAAEVVDAGCRSALKSLGIRHPITVTMLRVQATVARERGDLDLAAERLHDLIDLLELEADTDDAMLHALLGDLAFVELDRGDLAAASALLERMLPMSERMYGAESGRMASSLSELADVLTAQGRVGEALVRQAEAARLLRRQLERELTTLTEDQRLQWAASQRFQVDRLVSQALEHADAALFGLAYDELRNWKGLVSRGLLRERRWIEKDADPELMALVGRLRRTVARLSAGVLGEHLDLDADGKDDIDLGALLDERYDLEEQIARLGVGRTTSSATTLAQIQSGLDSEDALVDLAVLRGGGRDRAVAFVTRAEGPVQLVDLGRASTLRAAVTAHLDALGAERTTTATARGRSRGAPRQSVPEAAGVRELLWERMLPYLDGAQRVFVCPEAELATLPFETIPGDRDGSFLIEEYAFVYLQSAADLLSEREPSASDGRLVVLGGVDYGVTTGAGPGARPDEAHAGDDPLQVFHGGWQGLPGSETEARAVAALHERRGGTATELLTGARGSEAVLREAVVGAQVVHLATHGFFALDAVASMQAAALEAGASQADAGQAGALHGRLPGLLSGIVLAGANAPVAGAADDGLLTAEEVAWLDLSACELVVLSACETGLGTPSGGDNLIGLRRALYLAGADTRITSLWKVEDEATRRLMQDFYERLFDAGQGRSAALRGAQLALLASNRAEPGGLPRPSTWGAFVLEGAWW